MKNKFGIGDMIYHLYAGNVWNSAVELVQVKFGEVVYRCRSFLDTDIPEDEAYATRAEALEALLAANRKQLDGLQKDVHRLEVDIATIEEQIKAERGHGTDNQEEQ